MKYYNANELKYYGNISKKGYFDIREHGTYCKEIRDNDIQKIRKEYKVNNSTKKKDCSYCQAILYDGKLHNIRTCYNKQRICKPSFENWDTGEFKLLHIGDTNIKDLSRDHNIFTFSEVKTNDDHDNLYDEKGINYDDNPIYEIDTSNLANMDSIECTDENIVVEFNNNRQTPENVILEMKHLTERPDDTPVKNVMIQRDQEFYHIHWGIEKKENMPRVYNTCVLDSWLFIMYHLKKTNDIVEYTINGQNEIVKTTMKHYQKKINRMRLDCLLGKKRIV